MDISGTTGANLLRVPRSDHPPPRAVAWYLRSLADADTHKGALGDDGLVTALCGAVFAPKRTVAVDLTEGVSRLQPGPLELPGNPADKAQVCPLCHAAATRAE